MTQSAPADAVDAVLAEHADLERQLSDPDLHNDTVNARRVGKRFAQLAPIAGTYRKFTLDHEDTGNERHHAVRKGSGQAYRHDGRRQVIGHPIGLLRQSHRQGR